MDYVRTSVGARFGRENMTVMILCLENATTSKELYSVANPYYDVEMVVLMEEF